MEQNGNAQTTGAALGRRPGVHATRSSSRVTDKEQPPTPKNSSTSSNTAPQNARSQHHAPTGPPSRAATIDNSEHPKKTAKSPPSPQQIKMAELEEFALHQGSEIEQLSKQIEFLQSDLYRQEVTSIRTHLQVNDLQEPWQISQKFEEITKQVENISRNLSERLAQSKFTGSPKTVDLVRYPRHYMSRSELKHPATEATYAIEPEDFIDFGCRALINDCLMKMFDPNVFHPALKPEQNQMLVSMYERIREKEPQVIAGRWRVSSFNSYEKLSYFPKEQARKLCREILSSFCAGPFNQEACTEAINSISSDVEKLFEYAWSWNVLTKTSVVMLDFHPYHVLPGELYNPADTNLEGGRKAKPPTSGSILVTTRLGLMSSEASGKSTPPQYSYQLKANVLAAEYFA